MAWGKKKSELSSDELKRLNDLKKVHATGAQFKESMYNKIVDRYTRNGREFSFSDQFVWKGSIYQIPEIFGYIMFFAIFLTLALLSFKRYGEARTIVFVMLLMTWRLNMMLKQLSQLNKKL